MSTTCRDCHATWTGLKEGHCTGCHRTFGGVTGFDRHKKPTGECLDPAPLGLVEVSRVGHSAWVRPVLPGDAPWALHRVTQKPAPGQPRLGEGDGPKTASLSGSDELSIRAEGSA